MYQAHEWVRRIEIGGGRLTHRLLCPRVRARSPMDCWGILLVDPQVHKVLGTFTFLRFRMGVHRLPKDEGSWNRVPRHERICLLCNSGSLCDEKHVVFECSSLQGLRAEYAFLFSDMCTMKQFLWQDDLVSVAKFIHACLDKMFSCATLHFSAEVQLKP